MTTLRQVVNVVETLYPLRYAESWDAPGLIVGEPGADVGLVAFAADPTMAVIDEAIERGADLLICHHPLLFRSVHAVSGQDVHGAIVGKLYSHHCALWVGHTNADAAWRGVGQAAADAFGLVDQRPLVPIDDPGSAHAVGLGRVGLLEEPMTLERFAHRVAQALPATNLGIQVAGDLPVARAARRGAPGSGDSLFDEVRASGADVYDDQRPAPIIRRPDALEQARYEASLLSRGLAAPSAGNTGTAGNAVARPALINTPHSAIESLWFRYAPDDIAAAVERATGETIRTTHITMNTDPWTLNIPCRG